MPDDHGEETPLKPGWNRALPETIPHPTYWPVTLALGIMFIGWGLISTPLVSGIGVLIFATAIAGWIREMIDDSRHH